VQAPIGIGELSRLTGASEATLRSWERRHATAITARALAYAA
jgi:DNA-binding transcriptional MerR regulator